MNKVSTDIFSVGVNDCETVLFEELWPLTDGISYNSYLIIDDKIALIDSVEYPFAEETIENIHKVIGDRAIDYLIVNHMEPDHSSSIKKMRE
ncbi:MAG: FprA family A-type flavoprotein, partial [Bacteroidales bacterium]